MRYVLLACDDPLNPRVVFTAPYEPGGSLKIANTAIGLRMHQSFSIWLDPQKSGQEPTCLVYYKRRADGVLFADNAWAAYGKFCMPLDSRARKPTG